ncbi:hypothetical protein ACMDCR_11010 [Labrys okinawensis]|uniref:hypothetical protein n=1 Tax=Labrys okinawensis TaxID=346911 RepID=UPI0039BD751D
MESAQPHWTKSVRIFDWIDVGSTSPAKYPNTWLLQGLLDDEAAAERVRDYERGTSIDIHYACTFTVVLVDDSEQAVTGLVKLPRVRRNVTNRVIANLIFFMFKTSGSINFKDHPQIKDLVLLKEVASGWSLP